MKKVSVLSLFLAFSLVSLSWSADEDAGVLRDCGEVYQQASSPGFRRQGPPVLPRNKSSDASSSAIVRVSNVSGNISVLPTSTQVNVDLFRDSLIPQKRVDTNDAQVKLTQATARLHAIGKSARNESDSIRDDCEELDRTYEKLPVELQGFSSGVVVNQGVMAPFFNEHLYVVELPTDTLNSFNPQRWATNLSVINAGSYPGYLNLEPHAAATLADTLHFGARHCTSHNDQSGHRYTGTGHCCQAYLRGIRCEMIAMAQLASKHSRSHEAYVEEFNKFDRKVSLVHGHHTTLVTTYGAIFSPQAYPVKPVNNYVRFDFRNWLIQLAPNNNTSEILSFTDLEDPGMMAEKVYSTCRYGACGGGTSHQYTGWNYCGANHLRAMKVEIFEVALSLLRNQRHHDNYVNEAQRFEAAARAMLSNYWLGLRGWNGLPVSVGQTVVQQAQSSPAQTSYQSLKNNRDQLRSHLRKSVRVLEDAAACESIADGLTSVGGSLCSAVDSNTSSNGERNIIGQIVVSDLVTKVETFGAEKIADLATIDRLKEKNEELTERTRNEAWATREREMRAEFQKTSEAREREARERDRRSISFLLGQMVYELNMRRDRNDLRFFDNHSFEDMSREAQLFVVDELRRMTTPR